MVDKAKKLQLLQEQIDAVGSGKFPFDDWRYASLQALCHALGADHRYATQFSDIVFAIEYPPLLADPGDTPANRVHRALPILRVALREVELLADEEGPLPTGPDVSSRPQGEAGQVFLVHGHNDGRRLEVQRLVEGLAAVVPTVLHEKPNGGRTLIEKFEAEAEAAGFAIVLLTSDDVGRAKGDASDRPRARQNVILELGYFFGKLGRSKVVALYDEGVELPSDIQGLVYVPFDEGGGWRSKIAAEMEAAGYQVDGSALWRF